MEPFRKARLAKLLARADLHIQHHEHIEEDGVTVFEHACKLGLEGIVSKRKGSRYSAGLSLPALARGSSWRGIGANGRPTSAPIRSQAVHNHPKSRATERASIGHQARHTTKQKLEEIRKTGSA
jgi:hypothetical protein